MYVLGKVDIQVGANYKLHRVGLSQKRMPYGNSKDMLTDSR
jgi:hypothetical protein